MKNGRWIVALLVLLFPACTEPETLSYDFCIEEPGLFPVGDKEVVSLLTLDFPNYAECRFYGKYVDLDGNGDKTDLAVFGQGCCGNVKCPVWVLRWRNRQPTIIFHDTTYGLTLLKSKHKGLKDIKAIAASAGWEEINIWRFNGEKYVEKGAK